MIWPFKRNQAGKKTGKSKWKPNDELIASFRKWKPVGSEFEYLGRRMVVTGHARAVSVGFSILLVPCLIADYVDDLGRIHCAEFRADEVLAMMPADTLPSGENDGMP